MPDQMTIEQAAECLREKLPVGTEYHVSICALGVAGKDSAKPMGYVGVTGPLFAELAEMAGISEGSHAPHDRPADET